MTEEQQSPKPKIENQQLIHQVLQEWFKTHTPGADSVTIPALNIPASTGMSNITLLFDVEIVKQGEKSIIPVVGRLQPQVEKPVFPEYDLRGQYRAMEILRQKTSLPVPKLLGFEGDTSLLGVPFYFMERFEGIIPPDIPPYHIDGWMLNQANEEQRAHIWNLGIDSMAQFHNLDTNTLGFDFLKRPADGNTGLDQQLAYWNRYMQWAVDGTELIIHKRAYEWLLARKPKNEAEKLCWGDSRLGNVMYSEDMKSVVAVLDWEMATFGNPLQDLAWWNFTDRGFSEALGMPRLPGLPSYDDTVTRWQKATGLPVDNYHYYVVFAGFRYALILTRIMYAMGQHDQVQNQFVATLLEKVMEEAG